MLSVEVSEEALWKGHIFLHQSQCLIRICRQNVALLSSSWLSNAQESQALKQPVHQQTTSLKILKKNCTFMLGESSGN